MNIVLRVRDHVKSTLFLSVGVCVCACVRTRVQVVLKVIMVCQNS